MRVLQAYNIFGALTERVWLEVPQRLTSRGYQPVWICESIADEAPALTPPPIVLPRVHVRSQPDVNTELQQVAGATWDIGTEVQLAHGHTGPRLLRLAPLIARGVPCLISLYGYDASRLLRDPAWEARYRWAAERGAVFVVLCAAMRDRLKRAGIADRRIVTIHLGVDLPAWPFDPRPAPARARFGFVGRLQEKKGVMHLLEAMRLLPIKADLDIIGDGPLRMSLEGLAETSGIGDRVRFHGSVERRAVRQLLEGMTAFVLPSVEATDGDCEGTPIVLMEAQALGLPCITTRHAGNAEVLPPSARFLAVPPADPAALAQAMSRVAFLSAGERRSLQDAGRHWIELEFDLARTVDQYERLYSELIAGISPYRA
ncbi:MAG TPA: glycosyltransferase family 4 protein [Tepidisphaeraceae bacterium]|nr:glycosyltransferase family 4 protein [Tepidisphaeraceae bacterium]